MRIQRVSVETIKFAETGRTVTNVLVLWTEDGKPRLLGDSNSGFTLAAQVLTDDYGLFGVMPSDDPACSCGPTEACSRCPAPQTKDSLTAQRYDEAMREALDHLNRIDLANLRVSTTPHGPDADNGRAARVLLQQALERPTDDV